VAASLPVYPNHYILYRPIKKSEEPFFFLVPVNGQ
jgi:hypothetical protein